MKQLILLSISLAWLSTSQAQVADYTQDVQSIDNIIAALYDVISGEAGENRDWNRFKNLFTADARLIPTSKTNEGKISYAHLSPTDYVQLFQSRIATGFFEKEIHRLTDEYGTIVQLFSTYETRELNNGPVTNRGINSIQLLKTHDRYYIMTIFWCGENTGFMVPEHYLTGRKE